MKVLRGLLLSLGVALASCSHVTVNRDPGADLSRYRQFYVERRLGDDHRLDELLVRELQRAGCQASSGPRTMQPEGMDACVTYTDRWAWDFKTYLIELNVEVRDARTNKLLATARFYQPSLTTKSPPEMIREIIAPFFGPAARRGK
jgi:hypothetical protein